MPRRNPIHHLRADSKDAMRQSVSMSDSNAQDSSGVHLASIIAPALAFGATIVAKKALTSGYRSITGKDAPSSKDKGASLGSVLAWAALTAATAAVIEVAVFRATVRVLED